MRLAAAVAALTLCGCASTAELANHPPKRIYHSDKARDAVAECLLNRLADTADLRPEKQVSPSVTIVAFTGRGGILKPGIYHFTIRDEGPGSIIEVRTITGGVQMGMPTAETCF